MSCRLRISPRPRRLLHWHAYGILFIAANMLLPNMARSAQISCTVLRNPPGFPGSVQITSPVTYSIPAPASINASVSSAIGAVLATATGNASQRGTFAACMGPVGSTYSYTQTATMQRFTGSTGISHVYATNISGIGIRVTYFTNVSGTGLLSYSGSNSSSVGPPGPGEVVNAAASAKVEWIKTAANVANGSITAGLIGTHQFNGTTVANLYLTGTTNIISPAPPTCSVNASSTQTVNLGSYMTTQFNGVGSTTQAVPFNINFNCSGGTSGQSRHIYLSMTDATVPENRTSNLTLTSRSTASGVAVRIERNGGTAILFGADSASVGNTNQWQAGTIATGTTAFSVPLQARMIQTATLSPGSVSAIATFTAAYN